MAVCVRAGSDTFIKTLYVTSTVYVAVTDGIMDGKEIRQPYTIQKVL